MVDSFQLDMRRLLMKAKAVPPLELYKCAVLTVIAVLLAIRTLTETVVTGGVSLDTWGSVPVEGEVTIRGTVDVSGSTIEGSYLSPLPVRIVR